MPSQEQKIIIATRGSALALAQANMVHAECSRKFPGLRFELKIIKTTGDKLQTASMSRIDATLPRGLFTKELEVALLKGRADLAVHSLKDLPTELPAGLMLGAVTKREDVRDVLIYRRSTSQKRSGETSGSQNKGRGFKPDLQVSGLPKSATVATSSTRRKAQMLAIRPDLNVVEIRGNVTTRLQKLADRPELDATILAAAGLARLKFKIMADGTLMGEGVPDGLLATRIDVEQMLPCVGQAAVGIEIREGDERIATVCRKINHLETFHCVTAERAFLRAMGGGCQSPVGAYGEARGKSLQLRAVSFLGEKVQQAKAKRVLKEAVALGESVAAKLKS